MHMKMNKAKWIIIIIEILMILTSWVHYGKINFQVGSLGLSLILLIMMWHHSDKDKKNNVK
ncbi:hypothetical protein, partial [Clostridium sp.]|uniref:hypothetical protein n=1 Tax=Clostridium sp. TaxID=1506 RepID=UPI0025BE65B3